MERKSVVEDIERKSAAHCTQTIEAKVGKLSHLKTSFSGSLFASLWVL
jgi:hypothetical protein